MPKIMTQAPQGQQPQQPQQQQQQFILRDGQLQQLPPQHYTLTVSVCMRQ